MQGLEALVNQLSAIIRLLKVSEPSIEGFNM